MTLDQAYEKLTAQGKALNLDLISREPRRTTLAKINHVD
jgi:hypothetical protein